MSNILDDVIGEAHMDGKIAEFEPELIEALRQLSFAGIPLSIYVLSKDSCCEDSHIAAINLSRGMDSFNLVQGSVRDSSDEHCSHKRSWIEKKGFVYDPILGLRYDRDLYYFLFKPVVKKRYNERSISFDPHYREVIKSGDVKATRDGTILMIQLLEANDRENPSVNSDLLRNEIRLWENSSQITKKFDPDTVSDYKAFIKKGSESSNK